MKGSELVSLWTSPDNSRLTPKQFSIRFPLHVAAKISALCEMYPNKSRTEIIGDLMTTALEELESSYVHVNGQAFDVDPETDEAFYEDIGVGQTFRNLTSKYLAEFEKELDESNPKD